MSTGADSDTGCIWKELWNSMDNSQRGMLQKLMTDPAWQAVENYFDSFIENSFKDFGSVKRETEFETIWQAAHREGGKMYIEMFRKHLEREAGRYVDK